MNESTYSKKLDIVRILSCILVLLYHLNIIQGGFFAVCTFFVITGYLHTSSAMKDFNIKEYYIKRFKRIYIPLIVVVFVTVIFSKLIGDTRWINLKQETFSVIFGVNNFWQINANLDYFTRHINSPFMHFWYISILIQFEIIFPLLFLLFRKIDEKINKHISTIIVAVLMIAATVSFFVMSCTQEITLVYYNTFARSFSIMFGVFLALFSYKYRFRFLVKNHYSFMF